jgi:hypothetical protein
MYTSDRIGGRSDCRIEATAPLQCDTASQPGERSGASSTCVGNGCSYSAPSRGWLAVGTLCSCSCLRVRCRRLWSPRACVRDCVPRRGTSVLGRWVGGVLGSCSCCGGWEWVRRVLEGVGMCIAYARVHRRLGITALVRFCGRSCAVLC